MSKPKTKINFRLEDDLVVQLNERAARDYGGNVSATITAAVAHFLIEEPLPERLCGKTRQDVIADFDLILRKAGYE